ncbi:hypothetical protein HG531_003045 [Fusarium graminearum]|nr:hypothetical protein HG531_003045 [Fusarium graminearum]
MNDVGALAPIEEGDEDIEVEEKSAGNVDLSKKCIAYVGREDNKGEIAENILGGTTKAGTNLTITIGEGALRFGDG